MKNNEAYFKRVLTLFNEASAMSGNYAPVGQEQIADTGSDVMPNAQPQEMAPQNQMAAEPGMIDPNSQEYLQNDPNAIPADISGQMPDPVSQTEKEKFRKLFDLFNDLLEYTDTFKKNLKFVDFSLLDIKMYKKIKRYIDNIEYLYDKLNNYMKYLFNSDEYDRVLYSYILFRTELLINIKCIRDLLKLNRTDIDLDGNKIKDENDSF